MQAQRRRLTFDTDANSTLNSSVADHTSLELNETDAVNVHGYRFCGSIEPENADANANGFWAVFCLPAGVLSITSDLPNSEGEFNSEDTNAYLWGCGCWTASNQAPYHFEFTPSTSRNCQKGARIVGYVTKLGISAGAVRINLISTCFTS